jgi:hypothetical protein
MPGTGELGGIGIWFDGPRDYQLIGTGYKY